MSRDQLWYQLRHVTQFVRAARSNRVLTDHDLFGLGFDESDRLPEFAAHAWPFGDAGDLDGPICILAVNTKFSRCRSDTTLLTVGVPSGAN
jgi:hypothetical protein